MNPEIAAYHQILCPGGIPSFLLEYADAPAMRRLAGVGLFCGTDYSRIYRHRYFYSRLDHSLGVALIVWRFTRDRKQALAGLFHDIATPVFSHAVDFMAGDARTQTHTEARTSRSIRDSSEIMTLLARDGIPPEAVEDAQIYPIADNESPRLSADRLEYSLSTALALYGAWGLPEIKAMLESLTVVKNEDGRRELAFDDLSRAAEFVRGVCLYSRGFQKNENKLSLMFIAEILRACVRRGVFTEDALYELTEAQAIKRICAAGPKVSGMWRIYEELTGVEGSEAPVEGCYCARVDAKRRYIDPLVAANGAGQRASALSAEVREGIAELLRFADLPYGFIRAAGPIGAGRV
jgi:hypothetical protein